MDKIKDDDKFGDEVIQDYVWCVECGSAANLAAG